MTLAACPDDTDDAHGRWHHIDHEWGTVLARHRLPVRPCRAPSPYNLGYHAPQWVSAAVVEVYGLLRAQDKGHTLTPSGTVFERAAGATSRAFCSYGGLLPMMFALGGPQALVELVRKEAGV